MPVLRLFSILAILLLGGLPALAQGNPIVAQMEAFQKAFNAGDAVAVAGFYTEDGALLPPRAKEVFGRSAIASHYAKAFKSGVTGLNVKILEIKQAGPAGAIEIGRTQLNLKDQKIQGRYLHVWTNQDGAWLISRDIYHVLSVSK